jgi:hypothetical protein
MGDEPKSDFLAAEEIKKILHGRQRPEQERIIRWVSESLELAGAAPSLRPEPTTAAARHSPSEPVVGHHHDTRAVARDMRSFVQEKHPKNDVQFVAVAAYFHRFIAPTDERKDSITSADLQDAARLAPRAVFKNPSTTLNNAVQQGYMDRAGRGAYRLNAVGENLVSMTLPGAASGGRGGANTKLRKPSPASRRRIASKRGASG